MLEDIKNKLKDILPSLIALILFISVVGFGLFTFISKAPDIKTDYELVIESTEEKELINLNTKLIQEGKISGEIKGNILYVKGVISGNQTVNPVFYVYTNKNNNITLDKLPADKTTIRTDLYQGEAKVVCNHVKCREVTEYTYKDRHKEYKKKDIEPYNPINEWTDYVLIVPEESISNSNIDFNIN